MSQEFTVKISGYTFKPNENMLIRKTLLCTYFNYNSLNVLRRKFLNIYNLPFHNVRILEKWGSKLGQKVITPTLWAPAIKKTVICFFTDMCPRFSSLQIFSE